MLAFGLGTPPNLVATGLLRDRAKPLFEGATLRRAAAALLVAFVGVGIYRALHIPNALPQRAFCLVL